MHSQKNWIPACAGMTKWDIIGIGVGSLRWDDKVGHHRNWCLQSQQTTRSYPIMSSQRRLGSRSLRNQTLCPVTNCHLSCPIYALSKELDSSLRWNDKVGHHRYWCLQAQQTTWSCPHLVIPAQAQQTTWSCPHYVFPAQAGIQVFK